MAARRAHKRQALLEATERELNQIVAATERSRRPLKGAAAIGLRVGKILNRFKMAKHFRLDIREAGFSYVRDEVKIAEEAALDGIYVVRTSVQKAALDTQEAVRAYKDLGHVEQAFRSYKTVDLKVRPIYHYLPERVRAHVFLCRLAYYVEWHIRQALAPLLFDYDDHATAEAQRDSIVAPAKPSPSAQDKARSLRTGDGFLVHSFQSLLADLATIAKNRVRPKLPGAEPFDQITRPTPLQRKAFDLLGVKL